MVKTENHTIRLMVQAILYELFYKDQMRFPEVTSKVRIGIQ
jgi:hypothetical protein